MTSNADLGLQVSARVEMRAKVSESDRYKVHVEEVNTITSLLLSLSGRLARAENALLINEEALPEERVSILSLLFSFTRICDKVNPLPSRLFTTSK